jgi:hypothetical protein
VGLPRDPASASACDGKHHDEPVQRSSGARDRNARRQRADRTRWLAAASLIVVFAGAAGYVGRQRLHQHQKEVAVVQALDAARKYAVTLTNIDTNAIGRTVADILDGSRWGTGLWPPRDLVRGRGALCVAVMKPRSVH